MCRLQTEISGPLVAIGDIHGQTEQLDILLNRIEISGVLKDRWVVFLGDFLDRGPDPRGVIDRILAFRVRHPKTTAVCGNHELAMLGALGWIPAPKCCEWKRRWLEHYQSESTFDSYDAPFGDLSKLERQIPSSHREFLTSLPWSVEHERFLFVHAGLDSRMPSNLQLEILRRRDYTLNRPPWLCSRTAASGEGPKDFRKIVVSGHVRVPKVQFEKRRIRIDTSAGLGGDLSGVLLPEKIVVNSGASNSTQCV